MLQLLRFDIFELQEMKLPVRLINTTNKWRLVKGHGTAPLSVKENIADASSEVIMGVKGGPSWMKFPEFYCSRCVKHLVKPVEDL
ncbi:hypothetical protein TNCV_4025001 [Trichonephila clavipes]|uniref:Uncharacterized protein n=1 Tax=Trichonephila clavipes TaxID=2585209 RepID=A0A8X6WF42_TRICX|nr:hypothetical protein TNCV_4025001 [Trichonephila clavipes]